MRNRIRQDLLRQLLRSAWHVPSTCHRAYAVIQKAVSLASQALGKLWCLPAVWFCRRVSEVHICYLAIKRLQGCCSAQAYACGLTAHPLSAGAARICLVL